MFCRPTRAASARARSHRHLTLSTFMILSVQRLVHDAIVSAIAQQFGLTEIPPFAVEVPPKRELGDLAVTVAFQLARTLKKPPRAIAQQIASALGDLPGIEHVEVAPNGY